MMKIDNCIDHFLGWFGFKKGVNSLRTEVVAGVTMFMTTAYILSVHPGVMSQIGLDREAIFTATILASTIGTVLIGLLFKLPFIQAPGIGTGALIVYTVCGIMGIPWETAITANFVEGIIFVILSLTNVRDKIVQAVPATMKYAFTVGIGLFIALIGLRKGGVIVMNDSTFVSLGDVTHTKSIILCLISFVVIGALYIKNVKAGFIIGMFICTLIGIPLGLTHYNGILCSPAPIGELMFNFDFSDIFAGGGFFVIVITLLFSDLFDTMGTLVGVCLKIGIGRNGDIPRLKGAFLADAIATTTGTCMGVTTVTTFLESVSGVAAGGRTGVTSLVAGICFLLSMFLAPLFFTVPDAVVAGLLVFVGLLMVLSLADLEWNNYTEIFPAVFCIILMPFTSSIADGIMLSMIVYVLLKLCTGKWRTIPVSTCMLAAIFLCYYIILRH